MHGQHDDAHFRHFLLELCADRETAEVRHGNVEQHNVRLVDARELERLAAVCRFGHDHDAVEIAHQQRAYACANQSVIIRKKNAHRIHVCFAPARIKGNARVSLVSRPGAESSNSRPPASVARASMLSSPMLPPATAPTRAVAPSKPWPLSRTSRRNSASVAVRVTQTSFARA